MNLSPLKIALAGNPNSGKTSVFNQLTGLNQKVGNFPGVTVEKISGKVKHAGQEWEFTDFPGIYSLYPKSEDEKVSTEAFLNPVHPCHPDIILYIADYTQLQRSLLLFSQLADLKIPMVLAINKADLGHEAPPEELVREIEKLLGVKTILISTRGKNGISQIYNTLDSAQPVHKTYWQVPAQLHTPIAEQQAGKAITNVYSSYATLLNHTAIANSHQLQEDELTARYQTILKLTGAITRKLQNIKNREESRKIDKVLTHKIAGPLIFLAILYIIFQSIFTLAKYPMDAIDNGFAWLAGWLQGILPQGITNSLVTQGILPGIAGIVVFLPQIILLFFFLSVLEETGYMARIAFLSDRLMSKVGLNGKSVLPLLSGAACAIPAIMAARNIESRRDRLITIMVTPLMSCSARLPVYILLIAFIVPQGGWFIFSYQGLALMGMYLLGVVFAIIVAWVFKVFIKERGAPFFVMEMPDYQLPRWKNVAHVIAIKAKSFVWQAGKIILLVAVALWFLASFAPGNRFEQIEQKYAQVEQTGNLPKQEIENRIAAEKLAASYAGEVGRFIEPAIRPLGFDWKIGIALVTSFAAREVFVGTMATIYSLGSDNSDIDSLKTKMAEEKDPFTGKPVFSLAVALSLMLFYAFALQCVSTVAVVYKETRSIKWPLIQFLYLGTMAYLASWLAYTLLS